MLVVSDGHAPVKIPDVRGQSFDAAKAALEGAGFKVTRGDGRVLRHVHRGAGRGDEPGRRPDRRVRRQRAGRREQGPGPRDRSRRDQQVARGALDVLAQAGLTGTVDGPIQWAQPVKSQSIAQGTQVPRGTLVTMGL